MGNAGDQYRAQPLREIKPDASLLDDAGVTWHMGMNSAGRTTMYARD